LFRFQFTETFYSPPTPPSLQDSGVEDQDDTYIVPVESLREVLMRTFRLTPERFYYYEQRIANMYNGKQPERVSYILLILLQKKVHRSVEFQFDRISFPFVISKWIVAYTYTYDKTKIVLIYWINCQEPIFKGDNFIVDVSKLKGDNFLFW